MNKKDFYERNAGKMQFFINLGLLTITLIAVLITFHYSKENLELSTIQYSSAIKQFNYQRKLDSLRNISDSIKDRNNSRRFTKDSIIQVNKEKQQADRNKKQDVLNDRQLDINNQQLLAAKKQAQTLESQVNEQKQQYREQLQQGRPIFAVDNVYIDSSNLYKSKISFIFSNKGIRSAHVDGTVLAFFNLAKGCHSITPNSGNLDAPPQQYFLNTSQINIYHDCLNSSLTIYLLLIYYKDFATGEDKIDPIFFTYSLNSQRQFLYNRLPERNVPEEFMTFLTNSGLRHK
ncbi:MAG TPA: hypothetical protein VG367_09485 [Mucilaginibacter sp.]|jgi:hypothetical protein|nr:hypothetical protein [Mucilaginibacter sp.]